jgi:hypothetical protein
MFHLSFFAQLRAQKKTPRSTHDRCATGRRRLVQNFFAAQLRAAAPKLLAGHLQSVKIYFSDSCF